MKKRILLVGAGLMAQEYAKILVALGIDFTVVGRGESSAKKFSEATGVGVTHGGLEFFLKQGRGDHATAFDGCIVAVSAEEEYETVLALLRANFRSILCEKPCGHTFEEVAAIATLAKERDAAIYVAYNRRYCASVIAAKKILLEDGGVTSFHFEFTEWSHQIEGLKKAQVVKENWLMSNSSHVLDLAFYLGGEPKELNSYVTGSLSWHPSGSIYAGAGISNNNALFTYHANWESAGRWGVELMTKHRRLILRPLETLQMIERGKVNASPVAIESTLDEKFKPGLYLQTRAYLTGDDVSLINIHDHLKMTRWYQLINDPRSKKNG